jgi:hypothetical protein
VGVAGHVVHSGVFGAQNAVALYFMLRWAQYGFRVKSTARCYTKLVFFALCGTIDPEHTCDEYLVDSGSHSAFRCIRGTKCRRTIFHARVGPLRFPKIGHWDMLCQICVFHPLGSAGHVVHSSAFGAQNINALFFMLWWARGGFHKKRAGTRYAKLLFLHLV